MNEGALSDREFNQLREIIRQVAGINLTETKKAMVCGRLAKRLRQTRMDSCDDYIHFLASAAGRDEFQVALNLLTTNETYFFREPKHFEFLRDRILHAFRPGRPFRVWSAACSSGEEPYSLAMLVAEYLGDAPWDIAASDLSTRMLEKAAAGHYPMEEASHIPPEFLRRYCLKGIGTQEGTFLIDPALRRRVTFSQVNLNRPLPSLGEFDVIFLRNVLIYFDLEVKQAVVSRILPLLRRGGFFMVGHSESLNGLVNGLEMEQPSIYRKL